MTKHEFCQSLDNAIKHISELTDAVCDILPTAINEEKWAKDYEVPLNIFAFIAATFRANMAEVQDRLSD